jgi:outer membrane lipopolysaccharide assembly protein LptE/RlpB
MTRRLLLSAMALAVAGCGYALAGRGANLPEHVRRIGVPIFDNQSSTPELDRILTEAVRTELQARGRYTVVPEATGVDAVLTATIRPLSVAPVGFTDARQESRRLITYTRTGKTDFLRVATFE